MATTTMRIIPPAPNTVKVAAQSNVPCELPASRPPAPSPAKVAANQANAQLSTGPASPEGKAAVSMNAVTHGMCAKKLMLTQDETTQYESLLISLAAHYRPAAENETALVKQVAEYQVRLDRSGRIETAIFDRTVKEIQEEDPDIEFDEALALIFMDPRYTSRIRLHMRYHAQINRGWTKAISELEKAIKARQRREQDEAQAAAMATASVRATPNGGFVSYSAPSPQPAAPATAPIGAPVHSQPARR